MSCGCVFPLVCLSSVIFLSVFFSFFNDTATTEIYTLSLHDALPIYCAVPGGPCPQCQSPKAIRQIGKSTRLNSSHLVISYAVFCLKKKKHTTNKPRPRLTCSRAHRRYAALVLH